MFALFEVIWFDTDPFKKTIRQVQKVPHFAFILYQKYQLMLWLSWSFCLEYLNRYNAKFYEQNSQAHPSATFSKNPSSSKQDLDWRIKVTLALERCKFIFLGQLVSPQKHIHQCCFQKAVKTKFQRDSEKEGNISFALTISLWTKMQDLNDSSLLKPCSLHHIPS